MNDRRSQGHAPLLAGMGLVRLSCDCQRENHVTAISRMGWVAARLPVAVAENIL